MKGKDQATPSCGKTGKPPSSQTDGPVGQPFKTEFTNYIILTQIEEDISYIQKMPSMSIVDYMFVVFLLFFYIH